MYFLFFFFNDTATTEIYTLSLHDALPIYDSFDLKAQTATGTVDNQAAAFFKPDSHGTVGRLGSKRSEEHTSELQSRRDLVCRLLLEKKKNSRSSDHRCALHGSECRSAVSA